MQLACRVLYVVRLVVLMLVFLPVAGAFQRDDVGVVDDPTGGEMPCANTPSALGARLLRIARLCGNTTFTGCPREKGGYVPDSAATVVTTQTGPFQLLPTLGLQVATGVELALVPGLLLGTGSVQREFAVPVAPMVVLGTIGAILLIASWALSQVPAKSKKRALLILGAVLLALVIVALVNWADSVYRFGFLPDWRTNLLILGILGSAGGVAGWFVLRQRPPRSFAVLPIAVLGAIGGVAPTFEFGWAVVVVVPAITAWVGWLVSRAKTDAQSSQIAMSGARDHGLENLEQPVADQSVVRSLGQSAGTNIYKAVTGPQKTNTIALLSLIFGLLGFGVVPIVLGHIARSQMRRTGEAGRGMALAGLILGYVIVGFGVAYVVVWVVLLGMVRGATVG